MVSAKDLYNLAEEGRTDPVNAVGRVSSNMEEVVETQFGKPANSVNSSGAKIIGGGLASWFGFGVGIPLITLGVGQAGVDYAVGLRNTGSKWGGAGKVVEGLTLGWFNPDKIWNDFNDNQSNLNTLRNENDFNDNQRKGAVKATTPEQIEARINSSVALSLTEGHKFDEKSFRNWAKKKIEYNPYYTSEDLIYDFIEFSKNNKPAPAPSPKSIGLNKPTYQSSTNKSNQNDQVAVYNMGTDRKTETRVFGEPPREKYNSNALGDYAILMSINAPIVRGLASV